MSSVESFYGLTADVGQSIIINEIQEKIVAALRRHKFSNIRLHDSIYFVREQTRRTPKLELKMFTDCYKYCDGKIAYIILLRDNNNAEVLYIRLVFYKDRCWSRLDDSLIHVRESSYKVVNTTIKDMCKRLKSTKYFENRRYNICTIKASSMD